MILARAITRDLADAATSRNIPAGWSGWHRDEDKIERAAALRGDFRQGVQSFPQFAIQFFPSVLHAQLARPGSVIVVDSVVREGAVLNFESGDADIQGTRRFAEMAAAEKRVSSTVIQTVG